MQLVESEMVVVELGVGTVGGDVTRFWNTRTHKTQNHCTISLSPVFLGSLRLSLKGGRGRSFERELLGLDDTTSSSFTVDSAESKLMGCSDMERALSRTEDP